jgi:hypothetical protein
MERCEKDEIRKISELNSAVIFHHKTINPPAG